MASRVSRGGKSKKSKKSGFTWKDTEKANDIFSDVGGTLAELERKLNTLKQGAYFGGGR